MSTSNGKSTGGHALRRPDVRHIDEKAAADKMKNAIASVIKEGNSVTYEMKPNRDDPTAVGTSQMADAVIQAMK